MAQGLALGMAGSLLGKKLGILGGDGGGKKNAAKLAVAEERENAARAAQKSAEAAGATPSLMKPMMGQSVQNSINATSKMDKYI